MTPKRNGDDDNGSNKLRTLVEFVLERIVGPHRDMMIMILMMMNQASYEVSRT